MKRILIILIILTALVFSGCTITPTATYNEASDATNDTTEELTGIVLNGTDWYQIDGTFDSDSDSDEYRIDLGSQTSVSIHVYHNGTEVNDGLSFPITAFEYSDTGSNLTSHINSASGGSFTTETEAAYIVFVVYAVSSTPSGSPLPYTSGTYSIQVQ